MESRELPKRLFKMLSVDEPHTEKEVQDLLNQGYRIESMTMTSLTGYGSIISLYLTLDPNAVQPADPKS
jgi:hypothetical protein